MATTLNPYEHLSPRQIRMKEIGLSNFKGKPVEQMSNKDCDAAEQYIWKQAGILFI